MASTYVNDLRLNEMATGDASGTWGTTTNTNLELIGEAFSYGTEAITTNADTHTTTIADGATDPGRALYLKYTGTLDSACTITIGPNTVSKLWFIENGTTGSQNIILSQGSGANITIPAGDTKVVYSDGAGSGAAFVDAFASLSVVDLKVQDDLTVTGDIDVDGTTNLDVVDIDGAVDMASTALVTGVLTTTAATVFNGGFASNAASTISTADNSAQITLVSTDADASVGPLLDLYRNSASPADDDIVGQIRMQGENSAGETINYVTLFSQIQDVTDGIEDGRFFISAMTGGTDYSRMDLLSNESVFNQDSQDLDFRVESDSNTHALFVQGSDGNVGIGTASPATNLHIQSASEPAITLFHTAVQAAQIGLDSSGSLTFGIDGSTGATERMKINTSGDVGIGISSPTEKLDVNGGTIIRGALTNGASSGNGLRFEHTSDIGQIYSLDPSVAWRELRTNASQQTFYIAGGEKMRLDSSGNLGIGTSSPGGSKVVVEAVPSGTTYLAKWSATGGTALYLEVGGSAVGSITCTTSATAYNTSSDARLKDVTGKARGLEVINELNPVAYNWKADGKADEGLIAQEVKELVPNAVSGSEEEMYQMDYSKLVVHLVAGMKEQQTLIESLTARITTLEG
jgi:hypothetical protein